MDNFETGDPPKYEDNYTPPALPTHGGEYNLPPITQQPGPGTVPMSVVSGKWHYAIYERLKDNIREQNAKLHGSFQSSQWW